ncbi:MotA/TolQ/ExbB proton channel family protein [Candidatus Methylacidithermus pantelleriae]|uniref:Ferric siderophore transport system, biopolymer transport protein ExbB n=1 Tax=Candidatus Methylacidithermus pantelleriae TaxID=2744239 RepID=A0A8J2FT99_9BACT|nr:MotA/TolQ/ExbB proton channel family protein [Candidatus Methylacidithermus pantelleriae]CAF0701026.1 Ferric siderophore transport system, biopolymer transport protein ExbB [Candidatus Methylacidithermus pantelleriae]
MVQLFLKGGPVMWPLLILSLVTVAVIVERVLFIVRDRFREEPQTLARVLSLIEEGKTEQALQLGRKSRDPLVEVAMRALEYPGGSGVRIFLEEAMEAQLQKHERGLVILDTAVTLGPLLGLLGTVTGMMRAFGMVGSTDLAGQQAVITGGVAESLIAVSFGLVVAIVAIVPLNLFGARAERVRRRLESVAYRLEIALSRELMGREIQPAGVSISKAIS